MARKSTLADLMKAAPDPVRPAVPAAVKPGAPPRVDATGAESAAATPAAGGSLGSPVASGALRAMGLSLERLSADAEKARNLEAMIAAGDRVLELDPAQIDGSFVRDRLSGADSAAQDASLDGLMRSIAEQGQQVPILVRPLGDTGRYQVAYGHRRLLAVSRLGRKVRAIVRQLTDAELVIAQARENLERRDLSYIEKAMFARRLEEQFDRATIMAALGVDKADLSRLLSLAHALPEAVVQSIGAAPRAGRPRWSRLATALEHRDAVSRFNALAREPAFIAAPSDRRFTLALERLSQQPQAAAEIAMQEITSPRDGALLARHEAGRRGGRLVFANKAFSAFVREHLPELAQAFAARQSAEDRS